MATLIQFCNRCEERKYLKLCKKCTQYLCSDCKRDHICGVSSGPSTLYSFSEHLIKDTDNKPYQCRTHLKEIKVITKLLTPNNLTKGKSKLFLLVLISCVRNA